VVTATYNDCLVAILGGQMEWSIAMLIVGSIDDRSMVDKNITEFHVATLCRYVQT